MGVCMLLWIRNSSNGPSFPRKILVSFFYSRIRLRPITRSRHFLVVLVDWEFCTAPTVTSGSSRGERFDESSLRMALAHQRQKATSGVSIVILTVVCVLSLVLSSAAIFLLSVFWGDAGSAEEGGLERESESRAAAARQRPITPVESKRPERWECSELQPLGEQPPANAPRGDATIRSRNPSSRRVGITRRVRGLWRSRPYRP